MKSLFQGIVTIMAFALAYWTAPAVSQEGIHPKAKPERLERNTKDRPNIVIFMSDDMGWNDVGMLQY